MSEVPERYEDDDAKVVALRPEDDVAIPDAPGALESSPDPEIIDDEPDIIDVSTEPAFVQPWRAQIEKRPIVAGWVRDASERRLAAEWALRHVGYVTVFHVVRTPLYTLRTMSYAPRGTGRAVKAFGRWVFDLEGAPLRQHAVMGKDISDYMALSRQRNERVKLRLIVTGIVTGVTGGGLFAASFFVDHLGWIVLILIVIATGVYGRRLDKPLVDNPVISNPAAMKLTSDIVIRALGALGISEINKALGKDGAGVTFAAPITRDGPGWRADVDLPPGVTPGDVIGKRDKLASGLRRPLGAVWPEPAPEIHAARMVLWVGDQDMNRARQAPYPLLRRGKTTVFSPLPFGTDQRGRPVELPVMYSNLLIGSLPGQGKTFSLRVPLLGAALDPTAELRVFELKGSGDLSPLAKVAHRYASGPGDDDTLEQVIVTLREVAEEVRRRAKVISELPRDIARESKVTPEIAAMKSLRLHPLIVAIDECQNLFLSREFGREAAELCTFIIKIGRAFGVMLWLATQRPDKDSLPTAISANVGTRFCLRVMGQVENDMILGTSAYQNGIRATTFTTNDLGIGYLIGASPDPKIAHTYNVDSDQADKVADRAHVLRQAAGTLSGHALGEEPVVEVDLLADVRAAMGESERMWSETILARLNEIRPGMYAGWDSTTLANALRARGVATKDIHMDDGSGRRIVRKGVRAEALQSR